MNRLVSCNDCGHEFSPKLSESKSGLMFFRCPRCKRKYKVAKVSSTGRALRNQLALVRQKVREAADRGDALEADRLYDEQLELEQQFRQHVTLYDNLPGGKSRVRATP